MIGVKRELSESLTCRNLRTSGSADEGEEEDEDEEEGEGKGEGKGRKKLLVSVLLGDLTLMVISRKACSVYSGVPILGLSTLS